MQLKDYVHTTATTLSSEEHADHAIEALKKYLKRRGHSKFYPSILKGIQRELLEQTARNATKIILARSEDMTQFESEIMEILKAHNLSTTYTVAVDPTIIGGYIVRGKHTKVDHSYKMALFKKYQSLKHHI